MEREMNMLVVLEESKTLGVPELATKYGVSISAMLEALKEYNIKPIVDDEEVAGGEVKSPVVVKSEGPKVYEFGMPTGSRGETPKHSPEELDTDEDFDSYYKQFKKWLGWNKEIIPPKPAHANSHEQLTVVVGDLHVPYHNEDALKWMINRTCKKATRLIIGGDLADMFWCSKYMKFKQHFSGLEEIKRVQAVLAMFSDAYEEVVIMRGNHDDRFVKYLQRTGLSLDAFEVFKYLHGEYALHPVYVLAYGLPNVQIVEPINKDYAEFSYLYQQGDCVVSHAEKFSGIPNKVVGDVIQSLKSYHVTEGLLNPFRIVIQCHTHQAGKIWADFGTIGIENGCMALTPDYSGGPRNLPRRASVVGYTELWQTDGRTDFEKTNFVPFKK